MLIKNIFFQLITSPAVDLNLVDCHTFDVFKTNLYGLTYLTVFTTNMEFVLVYMKSANKFNH